MSFIDDIFGSFLGPALGFAGGLLFPEFAIPAEIAGGFLGGTLGGVAEGKPIGQAAIQGVESGAVAGIGGAIGEAAGVTPSSIVGDLFGTPAGGAGVGPAPDLAGGAGGTSAPIAPATPAAAPTGSPMPTGGGASAAAVTGGLTSDPNTFLNANPGGSFVGAMGDAGGGTGTISGASGAGGNISGAPSASGGGPLGAPASIAPGSPGGPDLSLASGTGFGGEGSFSSDPTSGGGVSSFISQHWPMLASAGILGFEGLTKNQSYPAESQLQGQATATAGQAQTLMNPIQTGVLPPGAQQAVDASTAANKAGVASTFGNLGLAGSTMEQQANQSVNRNAAAQTYQIASDLLSKGIDLSRLSAADLTTLLDAQMKEDQQFNSALTSFAGGLSGARLAA